MPDRELVDAFVNARRDYEDARRALIPCIEQIAVELVGDVLRGTHSIELHGEYNEDWIPTLRIRRVVDRAGATLFQIAEGHDDPTVEDTIDTVGTEYLDLLIDLTGDEYLGRASIERTGTSVEEPR